MQYPEIIGQSAAPRPRAGEFVDEEGGRGGKEVRQIVDRECLDLLLPFVHYSGLPSVCAIAKALTTLPPCVGLNRVHDSDVHSCLIRRRTAVPTPCIQSWDIYR